MQPTAQKPPAAPDFPVDAIQEVLQTSGHPAFASWEKEHWYQLESHLSKSVVVRGVRPRYQPAVIRPSDCRFNITLRDQLFDDRGQEILDEDGLPKFIERVEKIVVRKMDTGDMYDVASIGPQILEEFFAGDLAYVAGMNYGNLINEVIAASLASRVQGAMTDLAEAVLAKICDLMIVASTRQPLTFDELLSADPIEGHEAMAKTLTVNTLFFSYLTSRIPENIKDTFSSLTGLLSSSGSWISELLAIPASPPSS